MGELEQLRSRVAALEAELATARGQAGARPASGESAPPRSVEQVHEVFAQAPLVLFALDRAGTFTLHEGKGSSSSRVKPGELLGTSIYQNWGHVPGVVEAFERALGGSVARWEGGNGVAQYESIYAPQRDGTGQVIGVSGISIDVTARKRAEDAVRRSESRFRGMIEKSQEIIFLVDRDGTRLYGSAATERILGVKAESMVGRPFGEGMHPEDKLAAVAAREALLAEPGGTRVVSFRVPHPDGRQLWIEATMTNLLHDPDVGAMVVNARDVTEHRQAEDALRRSERRFRGMIEKSQEVIFLSDHEGTIVYGSPSTGPILGHPSEETLGKKFGEFTHVDDRAGLRAARAALLAEPGGSRVVTFRASRRDGTSLPVEATMTNLLHDPDVGAMVLNARDITERRRAEDVLRERQHALEQAQEVAHVGSWSTGRTPDDPILWTPECARIFRRPHDQPPTVRAFLEMVYPEDQPRFMAARQRAIDEQTRFDLEHRFSAPDGGFWWAHTRVEFLRDRDGRVVRALGVVRDITERHLATEALKVSEERYRRIVETTSDGILTAAPDRSVTFVNRRLAELLGHDPADLVGRSQLDLVAPAERDGLLARRHLRHGAPPERFDVRLRHQDGHDVPTSLLVTPLLSKQGAYEGVLCQFTDLTDRREKAEQQSRVAAIVESAEDAIISRGVDGLIRTWNPAAERYFQYTAQEAIGQPLSMLYPPESAEALRRLGGEANQGKAVHQLVVEGVRKDGGRVEFSARASMLRDADGQIHGVAIVARDMTGQRRAEADLRRAEEQLRQAQKMESVGRLAGGIAHDFNNLLTVIISYTEMALADLNPGEPLREDLEQVEAAGQRAAALTRQLLAFSRQQVLEPQIIDLNRSVRGLERILARVLGEDVQLTLLLEGKVGRVFADPGQVEQVLMNLVVNARDAMPDGGNLTVETSDVHLDEAYAARHHGVVPGRYVMLAVSDTGQGMTHATIERIFEPFFTTKEKGKGTGLGLATVFGIVKQSGGHIWVYSEPGVGSTFKVYLPRTDRELASPTTPPPPVPRNGTETVLLVEDEPSVRSIMRAMLRRQGYHVLEAQNGGEALLICEQYKARIHLLITDVIMPRMNGKQLAERLARVRPDMRVLYVSGYTENTIVHHGILDAGITFLPKPVTPDALARKMREVLGQG